MLVHAGMQEILVDRGELVAEHAIQVLDDLGVAFHRDLLMNGIVPIEASCADSGARRL
jgi:hypothetical protein